MGAARHIYKVFGGWVDGWMELQCSALGPPKALFLGLAQEKQYFTFVINAKHLFQLMGISNKHVNEKSFPFLS